MRRVLPLAVLLIFFISKAFYSQVVIKEKVGIKPKIMNNLPTIVKDHVFTYKLTWEPTEYSRGNIKIVTCSNDTISSGWSTSGSTSISYRGNGRHYFLILEERYYYNDYHGYGWYRGDVLPGTHWQEFIDNILTRITLPGSIFLAIVAIFPYFVTKFTNVNFVETLLRYCTAEQASWFAAVRP